MAVTDLQNKARLRADQFLANAANAIDPRDAASWSLAAKNAASVALSCETILKVRADGERRRWR